MVASSLISLLLLLQTDIVQGGAGQCVDGDSTCAVKADSLLQKKAVVGKVEQVEDLDVDDGRPRRPGGGGKPRPAPAPAPPPRTTQAPATPAPAPTTTQAPATPAPAPTTTQAPVTPAPAPLVTVGPVSSCPAPSPATVASPSIYPHELMTENCPNFVMTTACLTVDTYTAIVSSITSALAGLDDTCTASTCPQADWAGCVLRNAGHDFMDFAHGTGGADACTDMSHGDNAGLQACLSDGEHGKSLKEIYEQFCDTVSLADFIVIAAEGVMVATRKRVVDDDASKPGLDFRGDFRYGRTTAEECADAAHNLPNPENGCDAVQTTFLDNMGLDWRKSAALMAVHTLGRAFPKNSGYAGWWSDPENSRRFNNDYFISLRNKGWVPLTSVCNNANKNMWIKSGPSAVNTGDGLEMMLDTDMCLAWSVNGSTVKAATGGCCAWMREFGDKPTMCGRTRRPDCGSIRQLEGAAGSFVEQFAQDEAAWLVAFKEAWKTATENGFSALKGLAQTC